MKNYVKSFLLVLFNNAFLMMIQITSKDYERYGLISTIVFCLLWFLTFLLLVVGVAEGKKNINKTDENNKLSNCNFEA